MTARPLKLRVVRRPARRKRDSFTVSEAFMMDVARLSSGKACTLLLLALWARSAGRSHDWTPALRDRDLAELCRCHVRTIERLIRALDQRGLAEVRRPCVGLVEVRLKFREWAALPSSQETSAPKVAERRGVAF